MSNTQSPKLIDHWIGGERLSDSSTLRFPSNSPVSGKSLGSVAKGDAEVINRAVNSAASAFETFRHTTPSQRESWLLKAAELVNQRSAELVETLIEEIGSPITKARREVSTAMGILRASAAATRRVSGKTYPTETAGRLSFSVRRPLGVVAGMTPFNVPLIKAIKHSALPLATGNTVVLLPSEEAPVLSTQVAQLYADAGIPAGAFNMVFGNGAEIGDFLTNHDQIKQVGFTGSHRVGKHVQQLCGQHGKRVTLELGGKNPLVVLKDADFSKAIPGCIVGSFLYQGQICMSSSRIFVEQDILDTFVEQLVSATQQVKCGDLRDPQTLVGPIINEKQIARIRSHIDDALSKGATLLTGNQWQGNLLEPTLLTDIDDSMIIYHEETFGPVSTIHPVASPEEAIEKANETAFGLCGSIFTNQIDRALAFAEQLDAGMVHINAPTIQEHPDVPFGGTKQSGFGREGTDAAIDELTEWKWITMG